MNLRVSVFALAAAILFPAIWGFFIIAGVNFSLEFYLIFSPVYIYLVCWCVSDLSLHLETIEEGST